MAITFDPATSRIILDSASVTATEIYSRWVDWAATSDNAKYGMVFRQVGSDDLGGGLSIPPYFFLQGAWRVRPMETNHTLDLVGNLFVEGGGDPVVSTLGTYRVLVKNTVPVQAQGISTSGGSGASAAEIWQHVIENSLSAEQLVRIMAAALAGTSQKDGSTITFKGVDGVTDRIAGSFDAENNRTGAVLDGS